jgi:hypothetical protein
MDEVAIRKDIIIPEIIINLPINETIWNYALPINISAIDPNLDTLWYRIGLINRTLKNNTEQSIDSSIWTNLPQGKFIVEIFANDSAGNLNDELILTLYKDTIAPDILINTPINQTYWDSPPPINITAIDPNLDRIWYKVGTTNIILTNNTEQTFETSIWNTIPQGAFTIEIFANDSVNNMNDSFTLNLYKDTMAPIIIINTPDNLTYWNIPPPVNITAIDHNLDTIWYRVGASNIILTNNSEQILEASIWNALPDGPFIIEIFANDSFGHLNENFTLMLFKDTLPPSLIINSPENNTHWNHAPPINVTSFDPNLDTIWYRLGTVNITITNNTEQDLDISLWNSLEQGMFNLFIYANDTLGYINDAIILTLYKDTVEPLIIINSPNNLTYWNTSPPINITALDPNLDTIWYKVGTEYESLMNNTEDFLEISIWNDLEQGEFIIEIFANDSFGYINNHFTLTLYKDTIPPSVLINSPENLTYWNSAPPIRVTAFDPNLDTIWYNLGDTNITIENSTQELLDATLWNNLGEGLFQIYIYVNDTFGYLNCNNVLTLYKDTLAPSVRIISPTNLSYWNIAPPIKIIASDPNLDKIWYRVGLQNVDLMNKM